MKEIAVCTDFSENAEKAFLAALELAGLHGAKLHVLHVMPPVINPVFSDFDAASFVETDKSIILKLEDRMAQEYGSRVNNSIDSDLVVLDGHVSTEILRYLEEHPIDLVVMGSYGLSGVGLVVFGSVAKRISHKAPCSVMIVRDRQASTTQASQ